MISKLSLLLKNHHPLPLHSETTIYNPCARRSNLLSKSNNLSIYRSIQRNTEASPPASASSSGSKAWEVSSEAGRQLCSATAPRAPASTDSTSSSRNTTPTLLDLNTLSNTRPWSISLDLPLLNSSPMSLFAPWRLSRFAFRLSRASREGWAMGCRRLSEPKGRLGTILLLCNCYVFLSSSSLCSICADFSLTMHRLFKGLVPLWGRQIPCKYI